MALSGDTLAYKVKIFTFVVSYIYFVSFNTLPVASQNHVFIATSTTPIPSTADSDKLLLGKLESVVLAGASVVFIVVFTANSRSTVLVLYINKCINKLHRELNFLPIVLK